MWGIVPFGQGLCISDFSLGILYTLALSSLGVSGFLFTVCFIYSSSLKKILILKQNKDYKIKNINNTVIKNLKLSSYYFGVGNRNFYTNYSILNNI